MAQHKYESLVKFVHLDGIKEFKETNPSLFSKDGISTSTMDIDNGKNAPVTMYDAKHACELFLDDELTLFQLQQWGEWIHMMDFFDLIPDGEEPDNDESLINVLTDIDNLDLVEKDKAKHKVKDILNSINVWINNHQ